MVYRYRADMFAIRSAGCSYRSITMAFLTSNTIRRSPSRGAAEVTAYACAGFGSSIIGWSCLAELVSRIDDDCRVFMCGYVVTGTTDAAGRGRPGESSELVFMHPVGTSGRWESMTAITSCRIQLPVYMLGSITIMRMTLITGSGEKHSLVGDTHGGVNRW